MIPAPRATLEVLDVPNLLAVLGVLESLVYLEVRVNLDNRFDQVRPCDQAGQELSKLYILRLCLPSLLARLE